MFKGIPESSNVTWVDTDVLNVFKINYLPAFLE